MFNMENKKFKNIIFSLRQNFLYKPERETLEKICIISLVAHFLNFPDIRNDLKTLLPYKRPLTFLFKLVGNLQQNVIPKIIKRVNNCLHSNFYDLGIFNLLIESTTRTIVPQVCNFIIASKINSMQEFNIFIRNLVINDEGTVNTELTLKKIVISEQIPVNRKFYFAVRFFLGSYYVKKLYNDLSKADKLSIKQKLSLQNDFCLYFWMWQITGSREKLKSKICAWTSSESEERRICVSDENDDVVLQHIFQKALENHNEMGIQILWSNFISNMNERELILNIFLPKYMKRLEHFNIIMYLIFRVNENELSDFFRNFACDIIEKIIFKPRWKNVFFKVFDVLKLHVANDKFVNLLQRITTKYYNNDSDINIDFILKIFDKIPISAKQNLVKESNSSKYRYKQLLLRTFKLARMNLAKLFITHCNQNNVFNFFLSPYGLELIEVSLGERHFEFIDIIMGEITSSDSQISQIKIALFESKAYSLGKIFICSYNLEVFDRFINWCPDSVPRAKILLFRKCLPYINKGEIIRETLFNPLKKQNYERWKYTNEVLFWCLRNKNDVEIAKGNILLHIHEDDPYDEVFKITCYKQVKRFVLRHEWVYLRTLIIRIKYSSDGKKALGRKLLHDESLIKIMFEQRDVYDCLQSFVDWLQESLSTKRDDIHDFKLKVLNHNYLFSNLVLKGKYRDVKNLVAWCSPSIKKLQKFKNLTFLKMTEVSHLAYSEDLDLFLRWLDPSLPTLLVARSFQIPALRNLYLNNNFIRTSLFRYTSNLITFF